MSWQKFLCYADGMFIGSFSGLSAEDAIKHYQHLYPAYKIEVL